MLAAHWFVPATRHKIPVLFVWTVRIALGTVYQRGWTPERYEHFLADTWRRLLLAG
jgi:hypothetical protein